MSNPYRGKHASSEPWAVASQAQTRRPRHAVKHKKRRGWYWLGGILLALILLWPFVEGHLVSTEHVILQEDDLPADINHLNIVFISDVHYGFGFSDWDLDRLVNRVNSLKPDLVIFGGDYATDNQTAVRFFNKLPSIHARYGILGVIGDTDRGESPVDLTQLTDAMRNAGVVPLVNDVSAVRIGTTPIWIAGVDDVLTGEPDVAHVASRVKASDYVILVCHNPSIIPDAQLAVDSSGSLSWFDLGLFGHTHGGQMMFFSPLLGIGDDVPSRYAGGWYKENRVDLLVSRGVGMEKFPARLFCAPQIHQIEVTVR